MSDKYCIILCTFPSKESAKDLSRKLLDEKLIACSTIIPSNLSIYRWEGKLEESEEFLCIFKTKEKLYSKIEKTIIKNHPYKVPEILMFEIRKGFKKYLNWIDESLKDQL